MFPVTSARTKSTTGETESTSESDRSVIGSPMQTSSCEAGTNIFHDSFHWPFKVLVLSCCSLKNWLFRPFLLQNGNNCVRRWDALISPPQGPRIPADLGIKACRGTPRHGVPWSPFPPHKQNAPKECVNCPLWERTGRRDFNALNEISRVPWHSRSLIHSRALCEAVVFKDGWSVWGWNRTCV